MTLDDNSAVDGYAHPVLLCRKTVSEAGAKHGLAGRRGARLRAETRYSTSSKDDIYDS